jgi:hypothetical protein
VIKRIMTGDPRKKLPPLDEFMVMPANGEPGSSASSSSTSGVERRREKKNIRGRKGADARGGFSAKAASSQHTISLGPWCASHRCAGGPATARRGSPLGRQERSNGELGAARRPPQNMLVVVPSSSFGAPSLRILTAC